MGTLRCHCFEGLTHDVTAVKIIQCQHSPRSASRTVCAAAGLSCRRTHDVTAVKNHFVPTQLTLERTVEPSERYRTPLGDNELGITMVLTISPLANCHNVKKVTQFLGTCDLIFID